MATLPERVLLGDVPLGERVRAAREVIDRELGLSVEERGVLLAIALWPRGVTCDVRPGGVERLGRQPSEAERARMLDLFEGGWSWQEVADEVGWPRGVCKSIAAVERNKRATTVNGQAAQAPCLRRLAVPARL